MPVARDSSVAIPLVPSAAKSGRFLYQKAAAEIRRRIEAGVYSPAARLPTQVEFSRDLGVSQITVRRALAELVEEGLLYSVVGSGTYVTERPNAGDAGRRGCIAWISEEILGGYPLAKEVAVGIREQCHRRQLSLQLVEIPAESREPEAIAAHLPPGLTGAILLSPIHVSVIALLQERNVPYVMLHNDLADGYSYCVSCDYAAGAAEAGAHLLEQGCRRLMLVTAEETRYSTGQMTLSFNLLRRLSSSVGARFEIVHADYTGRQIYGLLDQWLGRSEPPDGILCVTDQMAETVTFAYRHRGLRVPEDAAVIGFGNSAQAEAGSLSSIDARNEVTGRVAMEVLGELMEGRVPQKHRWSVEPHLVVRESSQRRYKE